MLSKEVTAELAKTLSPSSVKRYVAWSKLITPDEYSVDGFVNFYKKIDEAFMERKDYTSILSVIIKVLTIEGKPTKIYENLKSKAMGEKDIFEKPTEKQLENKITVPSIIKLRDELDKKQDRTMREDYELQFLYMITEISPFRTQDYIFTSFTNETPNFVDLQNKQIIYTEGKTVSSTRVIKLPPNVFTIIKNNKDKYNRKWLFPTLNKSGNHMTSDSFKNFLNKLFNAKIATTMLRNIFVSHYEDSNMSKKERLIKAQQMAHTFQTSERVYTKLSTEKAPKETKAEKKEPTNEELIKCLEQLIETLRSQ